MMASPIMVAIDDRAAAEAKFGSPRQFDDRREWADQVSKCISECSRAAGTNAAVNWRDYGRSRWQLSYQIKIRRLPALT